MLTEIEATSVPVIVRVRELQSTANGNDETEDEHRPEERRKGAGDLRVEHRELPRLLPVPRGEIFREREVEPQAGHHQQQHAQLVEMLRRQMGLEPVRTAHDHHGDDERGDAGENGPDDEIRSEDRGMPHGLNRHREHPRDDRVHRNGDRDDENGHHADRAFEAMPLVRRAGPAERQPLVERAAAIPTCGRAGSRCPESAVGTGRSSSP